MAKALHKGVSRQTQSIQAGSIVPEVLSGLGDGLAVQTNDDTAELLIAVGDVEEDLANWLAGMQWTRREVVHTLWVILGPFAASEACAKKTKVTERIRRTEMRNL